MFFTACGSQQLQKVGFVKAKITNQYAVDGCPFLIELKDEDLLLSPQNLREEYKKNGLEVWLKYRTTKPYVNECRKGIPAIIIEIR